MPGRQKANFKGDPKQDNEVHIAISDPEDLRISILESARKSVGILQREKRLEEIRKQKVDALAEIKSVFEELMNLNMRLERLMPKVKRAQAPAKKEREIDNEVFKEEPSAPAPKNLRLDELEQELADIEKRMSSLR